MSAVASTVRRVAAISILAAGLALSAARSVASVTDIEPISLRPGANAVLGFGPDGETFTIVQAWRGNGNAHGHNLWLVLAPLAEDRPFGVVGIEQDASVPPAETISDDPFDGERVLGVVRFARAKIDGADQSIMIDAHLDGEPGRPLADHDTATIRIYRLVRADDAGTTPDLFRLVSTTRTTERFCNAELALHATLGLPLSAEYSGPNQIDGCF